MYRPVPVDHAPSELYPSGTDFGMTLQWVLWVAMCATCLFVIAWHLRKMLTLQAGGGWSSSSSTPAAAVKPQPVPQQAAPKVRDLREYLNESDKAFLATWNGFVNNLTEDPEPKK